MIGSMLFGWHAHFQDRGVGVTRVFDEYLEEIELAEELGFDEMWLTEHHFHPYGMAPSPNLILANVAARTKRIRLGNMVNILPLYDPLRLAEEYAMLDHLAHGRLNIGVGSGIRPDEFMRFRISLKEAKPRFYEALDVILRALAEDHFDYDGSFYHYTDVSVVPRAVQQPLPPLVMAAQSADSVRWAGERGIPITQMYLPRDQTRDRVATYREAGKASNSQQLGTPSIRHFRPVYVGETMEQARSVAEPAYFRFFQLFSRSTDPNFVTPSPDGWRHHITGALGHILPPMTYEQLDAENITVFGDPPRVREKLTELRDEGGMDGLGGMFVFGNLSHEQACRSMRLFAEEVMPAFRVEPAAIL